MEQSPSQTNEIRQTPANPSLPIKEGYTSDQRTAMLIGMFSKVRSDLNAINKALIANETKDGYMLTHEEAATASARLHRATTAMAALGRIFEQTLPEGVVSEQILLDPKTNVSQVPSDEILTKVESAIGGLVNRNKTSPGTPKHQG